LVYREQIDLLVANDYTSNEPNPPAGSLAVRLVASRMTRRLVIAVLFVLIGCYYLWAVQTSGAGFPWRTDLGGYYNYLGRAFAAGRLSLGINPAEHRMRDMALYNGRYYLYHGAAPAVLLFTPYRLLTRHDLPENFVLFLFCYGGFVFSALALFRMLHLARAEPGPGAQALLLIALGVCTSVPFLLNRVFVYEVAIGGGYFCVLAAVFFLIRGIDSHRRAAWCAAAGLCFGLAVGCRPHLGLAALFAVATLLWLRVPWRGLLAFAAPFAAVCAGIAVYNYLRFGSPFEFGYSYLVTEPHMNRIKIAAEFVAPGLYYFLAAPPAVSAVFPWFSPTIRSAVLPPEYFVEPIAGAIWLAPLLPVFLLVIPGGWGTVAREVRILLCAVAASSAAILLFHASIGLTSQRYMVDFLPLAVLALAAAFAIAGRTRFAVFAAAVVCTAIVNVGVSICGPYDDLAKNRPQYFVSMARWFSPVERYRPLLSPNLTVYYTAPIPAAARQTLLTLGQPGYRCSVTAERINGGLRLVSQINQSTLTQDLADPGPAPQAFRIEYSGGKLETALNGTPVLVHPLANLIVAPSQVAAIAGARVRLLPGPN
jgi:hypothetical protein